jgi:Immunity protein 74/HEAT repeats
MMDNETRENGLNSDARLRALLSRWDYERSAAELVAMGEPALERILDASDGHGSLDEPGANGRQYEDGRQAAVAAFAAQDMDRVLAAMKARKWDDFTVAISGIARVPDPRVVPFLKGAYASSKDAFARQRLVTLLGMQRGPEAVDALVAALSDRSPDVRIAAIESLGEVGDLLAILPLEALAKRSARSAYQVKRIEETVEKIRKLQGDTSRTMSDAEVTRVTPSTVTVRVGHRIVEVSGDAIIDRPEAPYFVYSKSITAWQPPHEHDPLSEHDKEVVLQTIREHLDRKGMYYIIDPTDEQYRTL